MEQRTTVFYVDDNPRSRSLITNLLEGRGFAVIAADSADDALEQARDAEFDVVLLDYQLPEMRGTELARELKRIDREWPVVVISGLAALPPGELAFVNAHLGRGTRVDQLVDTIQLLAERPRVTTPAAVWQEST